VAALESAGAVDSAVFSMQSLGLISLAQTVKEFDPVVAGAEAMEQAFMNTFDTIAELTRGMTLMKIASGELGQAEMERAFESIQQLDRLEELQQAQQDDLVTKEQVRQITSDMIITEEELNAALGRTSDELGAVERAAIGAQDPMLNTKGAAEELAGGIGEVEENARNAAYEIEQAIYGLEQIDGMSVNASVNVNFTESGSVKARNLTGGGKGSVGGTGEDVGFNAAGGYETNPFIHSEGGGPEMVIPGPGGASVITAGMTKIINDRAQSGGISRDDMASMLNSQADRFALVLSDQMAMVG